MNDVVSWSLIPIDFIQNLFLQQRYKHLTFVIKEICCEQRSKWAVDDDVVTLWAVCLVGVEISILVKGMSKLGRGGG